MKKTIKIIIMATVLMLMFGAVNAFAADDIGVYVDGNAIEFDVAPQIINDRTMIPFRYVANAFDAEVDYKEEADGRKIVTAVQGSKALILTIGNTDAVLVEKGKEEVISFDVAPVIVEGRTLVPVRLIGEAFGCSVGWDNENRDVIIIDILSGVTADLKAQCPEFFDEVLSADLRAIQGYYNIYLAAKSYGMTDGLTVSFATDDDAVMLSLPYEGEQVDIITTSDAFYVKTTSTMGLWVKYPYNVIEPDFEVQPEDYVLTSDMLLKAVTDYILTYDASLETVDMYFEVLEFIVEQAKAGNLEIKKDSDSKTVNFTFKAPYDGLTYTFNLSKCHKKDILSIAEVSFEIYDDEIQEITERYALTMEREDAAEAFDIKAPADDVVVSMEELMAMQSNQ